MGKKYKVLLYSEFEKLNSISGLGKAVRHQEQALKENGIEYTRNPKEDFDIVHINTYGPKSYALAKKAKKAGKKVVYHAHSTEEDFRNSFILSNKIAPAYKKWIVKCYRLGDVILTPTPYSKKLLEGYGLKNVRDISNGVDTEFFRYDAKNGEYFRKKFSYTAKDKVVLGIGLYLERKGILDFIRLAKKFPQYQFVWFGSTPKMTIPRKVRKAIEGAPKNLKFPGHVPAEIIRDAMCGADVYVFPTLEETEGIPAIEACAVGVPTIVRDIPVFRPWLKDGVNVYMAKDFKEFSEKIPKIIEQKLPTLRKNARKVALARDVKKTGKELVKIYDEILA